MTIADTIAVMNNGRIEQMGTPEELYESPRSAFVANFLGSSNLLQGQVLGRSSGCLDVRLGGEAVRVPEARTHSESTTVFVGVRPEKVHLTSEGSAPAGHNEVRGTVLDSAFTGIGTEYTVALERAGQTMRVFVQNLSVRERFSPGARVLLHWVVEHTFALDGHEDPRAGQDEAAEGWGLPTQRVGVS